RLTATKYRQTSNPGHRRSMPRGRECAQLRRARHRFGARALRVLSEVARSEDLSTNAPGGTVRSFADLHCHTSASFDSLSRPEQVARAAGQRGLTHLAVTDHDRLDGALRARDAAPEGLKIIVGQEVRTTTGDLIA